MIFVACMHFFDRGCAEGRRRWCARLAARPAPPPHSKRSDAKRGEETETEAGGGKETATCHLICLFPRRISPPSMAPLNVHEIVQAGAAQAALVATWAKAQGKQLPPWLWNGRVLALLALSVVAALLVHLQYQSEPGPPGGAAALVDDNAGARVVPGLTFAQRLQLEQKARPSNTAAGPSEQPPPPPQPRSTVVDICSSGSDRETCNGYFQGDLAAWRVEKRLLPANLACDLHNGTDVQVDLSETIRINPRPVILEGKNDCPTPWDLDAGYCMMERKSGVIGCLPSLIVLGTCVRESSAARKGKQDGNAGGAPTASLRVHVLTRRCHEVWDSRGAGAFAAPRSAQVTAAVSLMRGGFLCRGGWRSTLPCTAGEVRPSPSDYCRLGSLALSLATRPLDHPVCALFPGPAPSGAGEAHFFDALSEFAHPLDALLRWGWDLTRAGALACRDGRGFGSQMEIRLPFQRHGADREPREPGLPGMGS